MAGSPSCGLVGLEAVGLAQRVVSGETRATRVPRRDVPLRQRVRSRLEASGDAVTTVPQAIIRCAVRDERVRWNVSVYQQKTLLEMEG